MLAVIVGYLAWLPISRPNTSPNRSEQPFITSACRVKSVVELTTPYNLTTFFTLSRSPRASFKVLIICKAD